MILLKGEGKRYALNTKSSQAKSNEMIYKNKFKIKTYKGLQRKIKKRVFFYRKKNYHRRIPN